MPRSDRHVHAQTDTYAKGTVDALGNLFGISTYAVTLVALHLIGKHNLEDEFYDALSEERARRRKDG